MLKSGTVLGPAGQSAGTTKSKLKSGTILGPVNEKTLKSNKPVESVLVLPDMPVSKQIHLTDKQKEEAAKNHGFNSASEEAAYAKSNPNLYKVTGGQKYMENGYAALKNPQSVITPNNLTDEGQKAVKAAQDADAGKSIYDNYTPEQIDKVISAKWHRSTNDAETQKTVDFLKALKSVKEIGFNSFFEYNKVRQDPKAMADLKSTMDKAYETYKKSKVGIGSKAVDRYIGGSKNTESVEETQNREAWEKAAAKYYSVLYGGKQAIKNRLDIIESYDIDTQGGVYRISNLLNIPRSDVPYEKRNLEAALNKTVTFDNYGDYIGENIKAGGVNLLTGLSATGEFLIGTPIKFAIEMSGGDPNIISGKSARDALTSEFNRRANEAAQAVGDDRNIGGQIIQNVIQNIPNMVLAFMTAGGSEAATLSEKAASLRGKSGSLQKIGTALKNLANNPLYWMSFATTAGNDYEEALANGANPNIAMLYSLAASGLNAYIEIGGGVETLPKDLVGMRSGGEMLKEFITTSLEEGGEEILQGTVSKLFSKLTYDHSLGTLEDASEWAKENLYEGAMGVLGGAVMGGGQMTFSFIKNAKTVKQYEAIGKEAINAGQADSIIKYALGSDIYSEMAQKAQTTSDPKIIGELYSYVCKDVYTAINNAQNIEEAVAGIEAIAQQEGINNDTYAITRGIAVPQFIVKADNFEVNEKTAGAIADAVMFKNDAYIGETNDEIKKENPEFSPNPESDTDSEADNGFDEVTATDNAEDDIGAEVPESRQAEKNTAAPGGENINPEADEQNIFTEPDKREINENMINGRGLNIVQEHIEETAKKLDPGIVIKWDPNLKQGGSFNPYSKVLTLRANLTTAEAYIEIFKHEFMHDLELRGGYDKFLKFLENKSESFAQYAKKVLKEYDRKYTGGNAGAVKALFDLYYEIYTTDERIMPVARKAFTLEDAKREAAADFFADVLFKGKEYRSEIATALKYDNELPDVDYKTSLSALEEIAHKDKNLFHRIIEAVKRFISNIKGNKTTRKLEADLQKLERKLQDVYESAETKKPTEDGESRIIKFSLMNNRTFDTNVSEIANMSDELAERNHREGNFISVIKNTPDVILNNVSDAKNLEMIISFDSLYLAIRKSGVLRGHYHNLGEVTTKKLPGYISNPDVVLRMPNGRLNLLTQIVTENGNNGIISIELNTTKDINNSNKKYNLIVTAFSADDNYLKNTIEKAIKVEYQKEDLSQFNSQLLKWMGTINDKSSTAIISTPDTKSQENISDGEKFSLRGDKLEELRYNPTMFAKRLINKFDIKNVEVEELAGKLRELVVKHNKGGKDWDYNSEGEYTITSTIDSLVDELSKDLAGYIKLNLTDTAQEVLKTIRRDRVYVDHIQRQEIKDKYGSVAKFNKATGMRVSDSANASLDSQWQEWAELYPQYFDPDMNAANMPEECERIINSMKNWHEEIDDDSAAESIAREIKDVLDNTGTRAHKREKGQAVNEAVKKARADEREKADKRFDDYRKKESARRDKEAASKRKREYREKTLKLRDKFTKMLENPKKGSYVPQPFIRAVTEALDIIWDNPIDYDDTKIGGKYYPQLEKLNQEIQNASNDTVREALKEKYDRLFRTATNAADRVTEIKRMFDALKSEDAYKKTYKEAGDNKLFNERNKMYDENISQMLEVLSRELGDTEAYNYNEHQLRIISEVFAALDKHISNYNKLIRAEERIEVSEAAEQLIGELLRSHGDFSKVNKAILAQASPRTILNMLGNYETNSQWMKLYEELNSGENKAIAYHMKAENMIIEEILGDKELFLETQKMFSTDKKDLVDSGLIDKDGNKVMVTRGMRLCLIKHGLNEQNRKALIGGVEVPKNLKDYYKKGAAASKENVLQAKIPDAGEEGALRWFTKLNSSLTEIEKKWLKVLEKYYSEISAPALNEVTMQIFGFKKATVKNYWRMLRTDHFIDKPLDTVLKDSMLEHAGYLEKRKNSSQPLYLIDAIDQLNMDIDNHANYYGLVIPLSNFSKVYNYAQFDFESGRWGDSVKSTINDKYSNGSVKKYLENLIADLNGARHSEVNFLDRMRGRYAQAVLALNPRVAVKQTASYPTAAAVIGWKPLIKALAVIENKDGEKKFVFARAELKEIAKYSPLLWYRMRGNMDVELGSLKEAGSPGDKLAKKMPALLGWINKMDAATVGRLWYASKYYVEDNFKYEKDSPEYYKKTAEIFEKVIEETQPNYSVMQRPDILRSKNALTRALTMFYTQRLQNANILFDSAMEWKTKHKAYKNATENGKAIARDELKEARARFGRAVSSQVVSNVILNVMEFAIRAALSQMNPYRDKNYEVTASEILKGLGLNIVGTMFGTVLFGSELFDVIKFAAGLSEGKYYGMQVPVIETINDITNAAISDIQWIIDVVKDIKDGKMTVNDFAEQLTARTLDDLTKVAQPLTGIPIKNAKDMISGIVHSVMDAINGEVFSYEAAVDNNAYNRIVGARPRTNTQYYRILAEAVINDDKEKYESTLKRLLDSTQPDKNTLSGIKKALKASEAVKTEADKAISGVKSKKVYKSLSDTGKDSIDSDIRDAIAKEKILRLKRNKSKEFKKLFEYSKYKDKTDFDKLKKEFIKDGFSEDEISIGLEIEKFRLLKGQGITVAEWFTAKKKLSEEKARKNAKKYEAIQKMDFSAKDKETLWENLK